MQTHYIVAHKSPLFTLRRIGIEYMNKLMNHISTELIIKYDFFSFTNFRGSKTIIHSLREIINFIAMKSLQRN